METNSFIVEAYFRTEHAGSVGTLVSKAGDGTGYVVTLDADGFPQMALSSGGNSALVKSDRKVNDGQWHHLLFEIDRIAGKGTVYVDGQSAGSTKLSELPSDLSLSNDAAFLVGKGNNGAFLSVTLDFLRVSRGTLRDARTSIAELYAWQFHGPFLRDFTGAEPNGDRRDAGAIELKN